MMMKNIFVIILSILVSCSLYRDDKKPEIFFQYSDFETLQLGKNFSDMTISNNDNTIFLSDYNNNSILKISTQNSLSIEQNTVVGSHPIAIDISSDNSTLAIAHEGESSIFLLNTQTMTVNNSFPISLMSMNDLVFINDSTLIISSKTDPSCITLNLISGEETTQSVLNGEFAINKENKILYVATSSSLKKYNWDGERFYQDSNISDPYGFVGNVHHIVYNTYKNIVFVCLSDKNNSTQVQHLYSYYGNDMTFAGKYQLKSPGLATAISQNGERVFAAPMDADEIGVFIIEFSQETKLEKNYYLSAGNLTARGIILDANETFLYLLVNIPGDDDSFEPYNDYSFDLQRIQLDN
tara:strand:- start:880 stop:1938 length:1059 start_codon:yes stop_codon:yes gene_type:complete